MNYKDYSKTTWIVTIILASISILFDVLILAGVLAKDSPFMRESSILTLAVAGYILVASIRNLVLKIRDEKEGK